MSRTKTARTLYLGSAAAAFALGAAPVMGAQPTLRTTIPAAAPAPQSVRIAKSAAAAEIHFSNLRLLKAEPGGGDLEVTLRFDGPVDPKVAEALAPQLGEWIDYASPGYDSILIRTKRKAAFGVTEAADGFVLRIAWAADPNAPMRANLQQLRLLTAQGDTTRARVLLRDLRRTPETAEQLDRAEAELLVAERDLRGGLRAYEKLAAAAPEDIGLRRAAAGLRRELADRIDAGVLRQSIKDGDEQTRFGLRGRAAVTDRAALTASVESVHLQDGAVLRTDGAITAFDGTRTKFRAGYEVEQHRGMVWGAALFAGAPGLGLGGEIGWRRPRAELTLRAAYREPFFGFVESIVGDGVRDQIEASILLRGARGWSGGASAAYVRYGLDGVESAATAMTLDANLRYEAPLQGGVTLVFSYDLDAEYVAEVAVRLDGLGAAFNPLPLDDREVHSVAIGVVAELSETADIEVQAGYAYDRFAEGGLFARANLTYDMTDNWAIAANASYAEVNGRSTGGGGAATSAGLALTYRFEGPGAARSAFAGERRP